MINVKPAPAEIRHISFRAESASNEHTELDSDDALDTARPAKKLPKEIRDGEVKRQHTDNRTSHVQSFVVATLTSGNLLTEGSKEGLP